MPADSELDSASDSRSGWASDSDSVPGLDSAPGSDSVPDWAAVSVPDSGPQLDSATATAFGPASDFPVLRSPEHLLQFRSPAEFAGFGVRVPSS